MAFLTLKISTCVLNCGSKLKITDVTGLGTSSDGTARWDDIIFRIGISNATIQIVMPNGSDLFVSPLNVTTIVQNSTDYYITFPLQNPTGDTFIDGIYTLTYTVAVSGSSYIYNGKFTILSEARCCIDNLWSALPDKLCSTCDYEEYLNDCLESEALYNSLQSSACCGLEDNFDNIYALLEKICNTNNCNCS